MDVADNTVALVTKHCGLQLELYQKCVTQNPENWDIKCITQKRALAKCSEDKYVSLSLLLFFFVVVCFFSRSVFVVCLSWNMFIA